ncbi:MAG: SDR family oxidoreductase [Bacteroidetes bacterium]|uniref:SDR family oxidoreductase n=1 Tax=Phaeocystidibacter marisrubri TaxID=1577780 RepID=A0A6L3ZHV4_9FLAO|nr:SDR family oxidoreductase [Phaeocystidibacter marisrubri]KAB2817596.1 SDR family oxidoreductase [Phaeocystidibacter marisrubri]TNE29752.1 MAG: SDR family oxidoreductase [Bacteroidota bacterium]GGH74571.1 epimerase [Phaeocystidibacter marisrubri]
MSRNKYHDIDLSTSSFLITGGAGFIGSNLVDYLLHFGAKKVRVLDNLSNGYYHNIEEFMSNPAFEFLEGDIRDYETCVTAVEGMDYVSHQAALGSVPRSIKDPITSNAVNISGYLNVIQAVKENGNVKRFVYAASSSSYGTSPKLPKVEGEEGLPLSPYAITKRVNEFYGDTFSRVYGFHSIGLRYFNVFGPRQSFDNPYAAVIPLFFKASLNNEAPKIFGDGETSRDFTFVENAIQANIKGMLTTDLKSHEVINIACGDRTTLTELWGIIAELTDSDLKPIYQEERPGDVKHSLADITKARNLIGYNPLYTVKQGLKEAASFYINQQTEKP